MFIKYTSRGDTDLGKNRESIICRGYCLVAVDNDCVLLSRCLSLRPHISVFLIEYRG
jgi:hypothetical protein